MLNLNTEKSNRQLLAVQKSSSNTPLFLHDTNTLSTYSFSPSNLPKYDSQQILKLLLIQSLIQLPIHVYVHLDYLRVSSSDLTEKAFIHLSHSLFNRLDSKTIDKPWHPDPKMPNSKKYQNRRVSKTGIVFGYTKRAKYRGKNTRYVYDIMIDFTGAYFANLSLLEQINVVCYLNSNWQLKCHRLDVAMDDYSRKLFPVNQMIAAFLRGDNFGFQVIDDSYLDIIDNQLIGTLGIGSRRSSLFIRIYTKHKLFVRWETELKQKKAQELFDKLANLGNHKVSDELLVKDILKTLVNATLGDLDFRDKSSSIYLKNATRARTNQLTFWSNFISNVFSSIESQNISNYLK
jgi:hypothetical protein